MAGCNPVDIFYELESKGLLPAILPIRSKVILSASEYQASKEALMKSTGMFLNSKVVSSNPEGVRILFIFFDPLCPFSVELYKSSVIQKATFQNLAVYWIPVSLCEYSTQAANIATIDFVWFTAKSKGWSSNSKVLNNEKIFRNIMNKLTRSEGKGGYPVASPTIVWFSDDNEMQFYEGDPGIEKFQSIIESVNPMVWNGPVNTFREVNI